jgi:hypothetical protein
MHGELVHPFSNKKINSTTTIVCIFHSLSERMVFKIQKTIPFGHLLITHLNLILHSFRLINTGSSIGRDGNGGDLDPPTPLSLPHPPSPPHPALFSGKLSSPRPHPTRYPRVPAPPQYEFSFFYFLFHSFWLNYMKQKNSISMTTIDLLANQFATNQFT